jgi:hypothetical protein
VVFRFETVNKTSQSYVRHYNIDEHRQDSNMKYQTVERQHYCASLTAARERLLRGSHLRAAKDRSWPV